ncbi:hypothetical protein CEXT_603201 [Caerostris extrusa]|uniref:Uncharacterized protein n=1 Tax=Caerostris extrusa TaxID=172846 RepID=A0AAV4PFS8_CAEEX|nr:hypothetical protein CEXT_603201 [Caerostris extrusa]
MGASICKHRWRHSCVTHGEFLTILNGTGWKSKGGGRQGREIAVRNSIQKFFRGVLRREMSIQGKKFAWAESLRSVSIDCDGGNLTGESIHLFPC